MKRTLLIAQPTGFCSGVRHALAMFQQLRAVHGEETIYVLHELVHNQNVTRDMQCQGAVFVSNVEDVPEGATLLLGAHGCGEDIMTRCQQRHLSVHDATCPLVAALQREAVASDVRIPLILLGDRTHPEVIGLRERLRNHQLYLIADETEAASLPSFAQAVFFSQTTRCLPEIERIRAILKTKIATLDDRAHPCQAVIRRQLAIRDIAAQCDLIYIIGSKHSSNGRRLADMARASCSSASHVRFIDSPEAMDETDLSRATTIGIGTATSTPDCLIQAIVDKLQYLGFTLPSSP